MKRKRFTEEQIIRGFEGARPGRQDRRPMPQARDQRGDLLQLEEQVWRDGRVRSQAAKAACGRERQAEEAVGRCHARQCGFEGSAVKKMVTPAVKREAVAHLRTEHEMSERRACRVIGCQRMTVRYRSRRPDDPALRERLRALARERRRFGYRRLLIFLRREGFIVLS
jgi:hypothetical protein